MTYRCYQIDGHCMAAETEAEAIAEARALYDYEPESVGICPDEED